MALQPLPPVPNTRLVDDPTRDSIWKRYLEQLFNRIIPLGTGTVTSINVSSVASGLTFTGGPVSTAGTIVMGGTLNVSSGGTGVNTLTGYVIGNGTSPFTATTAIHVSSITGVLPIANGGTATSTALTSSAVMVSNGTAIVQGPLGTSTTVLHGNTSLPFYSAVALASDVSGLLPVANGGTGVSTLTGIPLGAGTSAFTAIEYVPWTTPAFDAANFTGNNSMTWTVGSGDVVTYMYTIIGNTMIINFYIITSSVGGTPSTLLQIAIPASKTSIDDVYNACAIQDAGGAAAVGAVTVTPGGSVIRIQNLAGTNWSAATNNTSLFGSITFGIN